MKNARVELTAKALFLCELTNPRLKSGVSQKIQINWVLTLNSFLLRIRMPSVFHTTQTDGILLELGIS
jgi:hypothetical protein